MAASDNVLEGYCTFYDYVVAPYKGNVYGWGYKEYPKRSINTSSNYADNGKPKLTVGTIDQNFRLTSTIVTLIALMSTPVYITMVVLRQQAHSVE